MLRLVDSLRCSSKWQVRITGPHSKLLLRGHVGKCLSSPPKTPPTQGPKLHSKALNSKDYGIFNVAFPNSAFLRPQQPLSAKTLRPKPETQNPKTPCLLTSLGAIDLKLVREAGQEVLQTQIRSSKIGPGQGNF